MKVAPPKIQPFSNKTNKTTFSERYNGTLIYFHASRGKAELVAAVCGREVWGEAVGAGRAIWQGR